jgi:diguanylate cyclase (GGDEF)-like protein
MRRAITAIDEDPIVHRRNVRLAVGAREYSRTLILGGAVLVVFRGLTVILTLVFNPEREVAGADITYFVMAAILFGLGLLVRTDRIPSSVKPWIFALAAVLMGVGLYINVALVTTPLSFAVVLLLLCTCGPATLAWMPFIVEIATIEIVGLFVLVHWPIGPTLEWFMLTVGASALSAILLNVRLSTVYELADATAESRRQAMTDQLTGLLNRHGLMSRIPGLWSTASRLDQPVFVVFVDIRGLKRANDQHGHEFGDQVLRAAGRAVLKSVREGDLVARWGGDELIVIGMGQVIDAEALDGRLQSQNEWAGRNREMWAGELSVGFADGLPSRESADDIISRADKDMYRRRQLG